MSAPVPRPSFLPDDLARACIHCGLCLSSCPTYLESGNENYSPRGRIYLMRALEDGVLPLDAATVRPLDLCLGCRACEAVCPSGVQYGALLDEEAAWGVADERFYSDFAVRVAGLKRSLRMLLEDLKRQGKRVAAYGAAAKGSTLLNASGIDRELLEFVVDRSTYKQGRRMPGIGLPIYAPEKLVEEMPDYVLLLTWNFADEILAQQAEYQQRGGRFIVPIPEPRILA